MDYYLWRLFDFFKEVFENLLYFINSILRLIRYILYKIALLIWCITTIGKWIAVVLLILNVIETFEGTFITQTKYFFPMLILFGTEIVLHLICLILIPKD